MGKQNAYSCNSKMVYVNLLLRLVLILSLWLVFTWLINLQPPSLIIFSDSRRAARPDLTTIVQLKIFAFSNLLGCHVVVLLRAGHQLYLNSIYTSYSDFLLQVSFGGFSIDTYMSQTVAFFLGKSFPQTMIGNITFDTVILDTDGGWSEDDEAYIVKTAGY